MNTELDPQNIKQVIVASVEEDLGTQGDITSQAIIPADAISTADLRSRAKGDMAGAVVVDAFIHIYLPDAMKYERFVEDGDELSDGLVLATFTGSTQALLMIERSMLNIISHLCGIATQTRTWVDAISGTSAKIRDTRKTLPGLRAIEKYAVRCGGGINHRFGLYDEVLIKDNHVAAAGSIENALASVQQMNDTTVEIEIDTLKQLAEAIEAGATNILLDNMPVTELQEAVTYAREHANGIVLEASGGLTLDNAHAVAATGVDYLAVGTITHSAPALDIGLDFRS